MVAFFELEDTGSKVKYFLVEESTNSETRKFYM